VFNSNSSQRGLYTRGFVATETQCRLPVKLNKSPLQVGFMLCR